ncbi:hypothetical protein IM793_22920 [Pedobacter sp. MR2016-19]|uniref:hypothetical protein n=1 Tax=Pedobacter sp. MR2016-19 TaxID=2780089 RepID=UPI001874FC1E|nr:hypothetical protein [Pedobacter sp. MR2016-19]MBE5322026.1 hypothetical protein [Pedobacter sp. MR2016-19]
MQAIFFLILLILLPGACFAQIPYIEFTRDKTIGDNSFIKGEIYESTAGGKSFLYKGDTVEVSSSVRTLSDKPESYESVKYTIAAGFKPNWMIFKRAALKDKTEIKIITNDNHVILWSSSESVKTIKSNELGSNFRIIIPRTVTLIYDRSEIARNKEETSRKTASKHSDLNTQNTTMQSTPVIGYLILILIIAILFTLLYLIKSTWQSKRGFGKLTETVLEIQSRYSALPAIDFRPGIEDQKNRVDTLQAEIEVLKIKSGQLATQEQKLIQQYQTLEQENTKIKSALSLADQINKEYNDKVIFLGFMNEYAIKLLAYIRFGAELLAQISGDYAKGSEQAGQDIVGDIILRYYRRAPANLSYWHGVIAQIAENGTCSDRKVIRALSQQETEEQKLTEFKKLIISEFLENFSSAILLLTEELRSIQSFSETESHYLAQISTLFAGHQTSLLERFETVGLSDFYVPLFVNYKDYASRVSSVNAEPTLLNRSGKIFEKDSIIEVVSYGFSSILRKSETKVIIAS